MCESNGEIQGFIGLMVIILKGFLSVIDCSRRA